MGRSGQKGVSLIIILIIVGVFILSGGTYYYQNQIKQKDISYQEEDLTTPQPSAPEDENKKEADLNEGNIEADKTKTETSQAKTINALATELEVKQSGYCKALAPRDWAFITNQEATGADLFSPDQSMHAGWGIAGVYTFMYPDVDSFLGTWMPLAGYTGFTMSNPKNLDYGFVQHDFTSGIGKKGTVIYKVYNFGDPTMYVVSVYFAATNNNIWEEKGAIPSYSAISIRCVSQLRPSTSSNDFSKSDPSSPSDNSEVSLSDEWTEAIMGYENVYSSSTGEHYEAPLSSKWESGPEGSGYYRALPGGGYEKLERGFGNY